MPINYLGPHEERYALVQPKTTWVPRAHKTKIDVVKLTIVEVGEVKGRPRGEWRVYVEAEVPNGSGRKRAVPKALNVASLIANYRREDEKYREPKPKPARREASRQAPLPLEAAPGALRDLVARIERLEAYCRRLGDFDAAPQAQEVKPH